jgi:predicted nucleotidyltransferase
MIPEIEQPRDELIAICQEFGIEELRVFGSATTDAFDSTRSDIDFLVIYPDDYDYGVFGANHFELKRRIEELLRHPVDLVMGRNLRNPIFIESVC